MSHATERYRLLVLGSGQVGKTAIIRRYLYGTFSDRYKETVEDIFSREFRIHGAVLPLDIYDTNYSYPDMRRVSIAATNAFMVVFSVDNVNSFKDATELVQEVVDRRSAELATLPMVLVGNKSDVTNKKIYPETVQVWLNRLTIKKKIPYIETSAKDGSNIVDIFKSLLDQSAFPHSIADSLTPRQHTRLNLSPAGQRPAQKLIRRGSQELAGPEQDTGDGTESCSTLNENRISRITRTLSRREKPVTASNRPSDNSTNTSTTGGSGGLTRHGSLMRKTQRLSLKIKHAAPDEPDESDCRIS